MYVIGIFITGLGANLIVHGNLGSGAWDAVAKNLGILISVKFAVAGAMISSFILIIVTIYNKKWKFLIGFIPIIGLFFSVYFWDIIVFGSYYAEPILMKILLFSAGAIVLSFALGLIVVSTLPAMVYDEMTIMLMKVLKIPSFFKTRILFEFFAVFFAIGLGYLAGIGFGFVSYGSVALSFIIGPLIAFQMKWLSKIFHQKRV